MEKGEKMRLIDADRLNDYKALVEIRTDDNALIYSGRRKIVLADDIANAPTVDAEPVRHGKWTHNKWSNMRHDYSCSLCGCRISGVDPFSLSATAYYYCPECGAKMDEVEDG
jgi:DNA-directed RNA polymerase subunit RPC12/RpoP